MYFVLIEMFDNCRLVINLLITYFTLSDVQFSE